MLNHLVAITIALLIDTLIGDPPNWPHPVKWMGNAISSLEKKLNHHAYQKAKGIGMVLFLTVIVLTVTTIIVWAGYEIHVSLGILFESILIAFTIARRNLAEAALEVYQPLAKGSIDQARIKLSYIVGRDTDKLDEGEIVRGTVETVAENTSDGVTAPLFWALLGGAPLAMVYRLINTCDSMVGYKNERYLHFGWASARLDDLVNWIPSRITGILIVLGHKPEWMGPKEAWKVLFRDARRHPSPNSGWTEAAAAAILGVQLGGVNYYKGVVSNRATMGDPIIPLHKGHILKVNRILTKASILFTLVLWIGGILIEMAYTWFESSLFI